MRRRVVGHVASIPYLTKTNAIKDFLRKIQETGVPSKVSQEHLASIGFTSSSDRPLIPLFKFLGFLDTSGAPTDLYRKYRDRKQSPKILAKTVATAYSGLYATYPDAHKRDTEALANYFRTTTGLGETAVGAIVGTFKALAANAEFEGLEEVEVELEEEGEAVSKKIVRGVVRVPSATSSIVINIQLTLPITENESIYDNLFASLRKNLLSPVEEEK